MPSPSENGQAGILLCFSEKRACGKVVFVRIEDAIKVKGSKLTPASPAAIFQNTL